MTGKTPANRSLFEPWVLISRIVTFWALPPMLKACGLHDKAMQQAWREKITLCVIIACLGGFVAFIIVGLSSVLCPPSQAASQQTYATYNDTVNSGKALGRARKQKGLTPYSVMKLGYWVLRDGNLISLPQKPPLASTFTLWLKYLAQISPTISSMALMWRPAKTCQLRHLLFKQ